MLQDFFTLIQKNSLLGRTAAGRRVGPFRATIVPVEELPSEQLWKLPEQEKQDSDDESSDDGREAGSEDDMETN